MAEYIGIDHFATSHTSFPQPSIGNDGSQQVGSAYDQNLAGHAALWTGTAESFIDLHPPGYVQSEARGVANGQQVGRGSFEGNGHALLWGGTAGSVVDLNPGPNNEWGSEANATNGQVQVGLARTIGSHFHAAMWQGTAASYSNLHDYLPGVYSGTGAYSVAQGVDEFGNIVGWARHVPSGAAHAVLWNAVPEPSSAFLVGLSTLFLVFRAQIMNRLDTRIARCTPQLSSGKFS